MQKAKDQMQWTYALPAMWASQARMYVIICVQHFRIGAKTFFQTVGRYAPNCCSNNFKDSEYVFCNQCLSYLLSHALTGAIEILQQGIPIHEPANFYVARAS